MFYKKNLPSMERLLRALTGLLLAVAVFTMPLGDGLRWLLAASGAGLALTGFIGFCPMCAMAGRKLDQHD